MLRLEVDHRDRAVSNAIAVAGATSACRNRLPGVSRAEQTQMAGTRGEREQLLGPWRAQPLEIDGQLCPIKSSRAGADGNVCAATRGPISRPAPAGPLRPSCAAIRPPPRHGWMAVSRPSVQRPRRCSGGRTDSHEGLRRPACRRDPRGPRAWSAASGPIAPGSECVSGCSSYGPVSVRDRATVTACPHPVPPSAVSR